MRADPYQVFLAVVAIALMIGLPFLLHLAFEVLCGRWEERFNRWRFELSMTWRSRGRGVMAHKRDVRALRRQTGAPIERVAADIRRLRLLVGLEVERSAVQQLGARMAYDQVLVQACTMLGLEHELAAQTGGMEREIERLRVEAALENAGLALIDRRYDQAA